MMNARTIVHMLCLAALGIGVYLVKYSVEDVQRDMKTLKRDLAVEKESLHLLNAEWAYLNRPDRLRRLADRHLELEPMDSRRIGNVGVLPAAATGEDSVGESDMIRHVSAEAR